MPPWILVTPSSRGIGLQLARRLLRQTALPVVVTSRSNTAQLQEAILQAEAAPSSADDADSVQPAVSTRAEAPRDSESRLTVLNLDVTSEDSIASAAGECSKRFDPKSKDRPSHLHLAFCIPGILHPEKSPAQLQLEDVRAQFDTNLIGPMLVLKHFSPFLPRKSTPGLPPSSKEAGEAISVDHSTWVNMSARVGSITDNNLGGWYSYRASKAGVNQLTKTFDNYLKTLAGDKALAISMHPGTVKTGLSQDFWNNVKKDKLFSPEYAAERLLDVVRTRQLGDRGRCWDWKGEEVPP